MRSVIKRAWVVLATVSLVNLVSPGRAPAVDEAVLVGAGDIASCSSTGDEATAALLDQVVSANPGATVFTTGDSVYDNGTAQQFTDCYHPSWGRHRAATRPAPGNHDYNTVGASGYYGYFGTSAGDAAAGYYTYPAGTWQVIVLNSNCSAIGGCGAGSAQEQWLRNVLATSTAECTLAYWHHPLFSSGATHGSDATFRPLWQALYEYGADVVLAGHDHVYERFAPQTPAGLADDAFGIRQFTVGTGGRSHYRFNISLPTSERRNSDTFGVLKLTLRAGSYAWQFLPEAGKTFTDEGTGTCHGVPELPPAPAEPITHHGSSRNAQGTTRTAMTLARPAGTVAGDVLLASVTVSSDTPVSIPPGTGWTLIRTDAIPGSLRQSIYSRVAAAGDPPSWTWTTPVPQRLAGGISAYGGVDTTAPVQSTAVADAAQDRQITAPSLENVPANAMVVFRGAINAPTGITPPGGMVERFEAVSKKAKSAGSAVAEAADAILPAGGATGSRTATAKTAGPSIGALIALRPAG